MLSERAQSLVPDAKAISIWNDPLKLKVTKPANAAIGAAF